MRVLAVLNRVEQAASVLTAATLLGGQVVALHVRPADAHIPGEEIQPRADTLRQAEDAAARSAELQEITRSFPGVAWREVDGDTRARVAAACGEMALAVMARPPARFYEDMHAALRGALLDAMAPVLLVDAAPAVLGAHIAVAWKPGVPAERAIGGAMPLLRKAKFVTVLIADEAGPEAPLPDDLLDDLERGGVAHAVHVFRPAGTIGAALGREAVSVGADLLVMGAFSHGPMAERMFGGATREVLSQAPLPVLMRH